MSKDFINKIIEISGLSTKDFAKKLGVSVNTIHRWKIGKSEPLFVNQKIIRAVFKFEISKIKKLTI